MPATATPTKRAARKHAAAPPMKTVKAPSAKSTGKATAKTAAKSNGKAPAPVERNKGGRPRVYTTERVQLNTRTSDKTRDRLKKQADRRGVSVSYMVDRALQESLQRWESEDLIAH